jgi:hypothetical protein
MSARKAFSLADLTKSKLAEVEIIDSDGKVGVVYFRQLPAGYVMSLLDIEGAADGKLNIKTDDLMSLLKEAVVDERGEPIFETVEQVRALPMNVFNALSVRSAELLSPSTGKALTATAAGTGEAVTVEESAGATGGDSTTVSH